MYRLATKQIDDYSNKQYNAKEICKIMYPTIGKRHTYKILKLLRKEKWIRGIGLRDGSTIFVKTSKIPFFIKKEKMPLVETSSSNNCDSDEDVGEIKDESGNYLLPPFSPDDCKDGKKISADILPPMQQQISPNKKENKHDETKSDCNNSCNRAPTVWKKTVVKIKPDDYDLFICLTERGYNQTSVQNEIHLHKSTISRKIKKLTQVLKIMERVHPTKDCTAFEAVPGFEVVPADSRDQLFLLKYLGRTPPNKDAWMNDKKIRRRSKKTGEYIASRRMKVIPTRDFDTLLYDFGVKEKICRVHVNAYWADILGPVEDIKWDFVDDNVKHYIKYVHHEPVPNVGNVTYECNKSTKGIKLIVHLPPEYLIMSKEMNEARLEHLARLAFGYFIKNAMLFRRTKKERAQRNLEGCKFVINNIKRYPRDRHYAFKSPKWAVEYLRAHGSLTVETSRGFFTIDNSLGDGWGEVELTNYDEAVTYGKLPGLFLDFRDETDEKFEGAYGRIEQLESNVKFLLENQFQQDLDLCGEVDDSCGYQRITPSYKRKKEDDEMVVT